MASDRRAWRVTASVRNPGWFILIGPYDPEFLRDFKLSVAARHRTWKPGLRAWAFHADAVEVVDELLRRHGSATPAPLPLSVGQLADAVAGVGHAATVPSESDVAEALGLVGEATTTHTRVVDGQVVVFAVLGGRS